MKPKPASIWEYRNNNPLGYRLLFAILIFSSVITLCTTGIQLLTDYRRDVAEMLDAVGPRLKGVREDPELQRLAKDPQVIALLEGVATEHPDTIADGIRVGTPGRLTFELIRRYVDDFVRVDDGEIVAFGSRDCSPEKLGGVFQIFRLLERTSRDGQRKRQICLAGRLPGFDLIVQRTQRFGGLPDFASSQ